jgi:hypothetical protein
MDYNNSEALRRTLEAAQRTAPNLAKLLQDLIARSITDVKGANSLIDVCKNNHIVLSIIQDNDRKPDDNLPLILDILRGLACRRRELNPGSIFSTTGSIRLRPGCVLAFATSYRPCSRPRLDEALGRSRYVRGAKSPSEGSEAAPAGCTRSSSAGSRRRPCCPRPTQPPFCSGRCSPRTDHHAQGRWLANPRHQAHRSAN